MRKRLQASLCLLAGVLAGAPAAAQGPAPRTAPSQASADGDAAEQEGGGPSVPGIVLMVVGGVAAGVGATVLLVEAASPDPEPLDGGLDPGLGGARGRAGQLPLVVSSDATAVGAVLLGAGTLVHLVGIVFAFGSEGDDAPPRATITPLLGPTSAGLRGTF